MPRSIPLVGLILLGCASSRGIDPAPTPDAGEMDAGIRAMDAGADLTAAVGGACRVDSDCSAITGGAKCFSEADGANVGLSIPGGYCTSNTCDGATTSTTCGLATVCADVTASGTLTCAAACGNTADCRAGFACLGGGCVPNFGGTPAGGYPAQWGAARLLSEVNTTANDWLAGMSPDRKRLCFSSDRDEPGVLHIYCSARTSVDAPFGTPSIQTALRTSGGEAQPFLWRNQLFFTSQHIYTATWDASAGQYLNPLPVSELASSAIDSAPFLTPDGLTIYFESTRPGGLGGSDLWMATRPTLHDPFGTPIDVPGVNSANDDWYPSVAADGSFLLFTSNRATTRPNTNAWIARAATGGGWQAPEPAPIILPLGWYLLELRPLSDGGLVGSVRLGSDVTDLVVLAGVPPPPAPVTAWGAGVPIAELNSGGDAAHGAMTADGLRICFTSMRAGGVGISDIWCASRARASDPFSAPVNQTAVNSTTTDYQPGISPNGDELYVTSARTGSYQLWRATWNATNDRYEAPALVPELNAASWDVEAPHFSKDGLTVVFTAIVGDGHGHLYAASRPTLSAPFGKLQDLTELHATGFEDIAPGLSLDGFTLAFTSKRPLAGQTVADWHFWAAGWLGNGHWTTPTLISLGGDAMTSRASPQFLADGSLLYHSARSPTDQSVGLYIAPPLAP